METRKDILEELQKVSPKLSEMPKNNPFSIPAGYFSQLDENVLSVIKAQSLAAELQHAPNLNAQHAADNAFTVPYGYFEKFPGKILEKVSRKKATPIEVIQQYFQYSFKLSYALTALPIAAMLVAGIFIFRHQPVNKVVPVTAQNINLSAQDIQAYLNKNVASIDEQNIVEQLALTNDKSLSNQPATKLDVSDPSLIDVSQIDASSIQDL